MRSVTRGASMSADPREIQREVKEFPGVCHTWGPRSRLSDPERMPGGNLRAATTTIGRGKLFGQW